jgi:hypothetical protein
VTGRAAEQEGVFEPLFILHTVAQHHLYWLLMGFKESCSENPLCRASDQKSESADEGGTMPPLRLVIVAAVLAFGVVCHGQPAQTGQVSRSRRLLCCLGGARYLPILVEVHEEEDGGAKSGLHGDSAASPWAGRPPTSRSTVCRSGWGWNLCWGWLVRITRDGMLCLSPLQQTLRIRLVNKRS